ncbi:MAG: rod shape-determining protein RodA [Candidatus Eremiobacteraeota bacterium]|nr:rod shape-determining protein RodA [Candidatus Eremiobacteraeota bacterium]MBV8339053.1 rod shape-determining protein RodA [Candidatus Eremiobacteraeota bacterium]
MLERPWYLSFNYPLAAVAIALAVFGLIIIKSATLHGADASGDVERQFAYLVIGVAAMMLFSFIDYHLWQRWAWPLYILNILVLGAVAVAGHSAMGAQRWIGVGPIVFQPSEPAKLLTTLSLAAILADGRRSFSHLRDLWVPLAAIAPPTLLVLKQPDLGTALIFVVILTAMLFFALPSLVHFAAYALGLIAAGAITVLSPWVLKSYQRQRLLVFLHPEHDPQGAGWSLRQSKIAIGSGQLIGKGLYHGTQTQLGFVPEHQTDFIFTVVGEELGFLGAMVLLALYASLLGLAMLAVTAARDKYGLYVAVGIIAMLLFQVLINIGMTVGIMPITGIPLPFISYGGSSLITSFMAVGVLLNIHLQRYKMTFGDL